MLEEVYKSCDSGVKTTIHADPAAKSETRRGCVNADVIFEKHRQS
jgi:hypothetical protein